MLCDSGCMSLALVQEYCKYTVSCICTTFRVREAGAWMCAGFPDAKPAQRTWASLAPGQDCSRNLLEIRFYIRSGLFLFFPPNPSLKLNLNKIKCEINPLEENCFLLVDSKCCRQSMYVKIYIHSTLSICISLASVVQKKNL